jgi:carboxyl-terminal processing protease
MSGLILQFAYEYTDDHRTELAKYEDVKSLEQLMKKQNMVEKFASYAEKNGLKRRNLMIQRSHKLLERYLHSRIIYNMMSEEAWLQYLNDDDSAIKETLKLFQEGKATPQLIPAPNSKQKQAA